MVTTGIKHYFVVSDGKCIRINFNNTKYRSLNTHVIFKIKIVLSKNIFRLNMIGTFIKLISNKKRGRDLPSTPANI